MFNFNVEQTKTPKKKLSAPREKIEKDFTVTIKSLHFSFCRSLTNTIMNPNEDSQNFINEIKTKRIIKRIEEKQQETCFRQSKE